MMTYVSAERNFYKLERLQYLFTPLLVALQRTDIYKVKYSFNGSKKEILVKGISYSKRYNKNAKKNKEEHKYYSFKEISENNVGIIDYGCLFLRYYSSTIVIH